MNAPLEARDIQRSIALDIHKHYVMVGDSQTKKKSPGMCSAAYY